MSIAIYVGSDLTEDGSVLLGGFGHEPSGHWLEVTPGRDFPDGTEREVGVTAGARYPGRRSRVPQEGRTLRFVTCNYSGLPGFPAPLTNGGLNEAHVAGRSVFSPSRPELIAMTPDLQVGLTYSDLARHAMERAGSAREAVRIVGEMVDRHGYAHYGGNSFLFADPTEGWVVITYAGGRRLWAAQRLASDEVRVCYPGYIRDFPVSFQGDPDHMGSDHLVSFAVEQGWFRTEDGPTIDLHAVYGRPFPSASGEDDAVFRHPPDLEAEIRAMAPVSVRDMLALVRDPRWSDDRAAYGQVAHLRRGVAPELGRLWTSVAAAVSAPMVPLHVGVRDVPPEYKQHRYMTKGSSSTHLAGGFAPLEATSGAYRVFKRLFYQVVRDPRAYLRSVTAELEAFEESCAAEVHELEDQVGTRLGEGDADGALALLTDRTQQWLHEAMAVARRLTAAVEADARRRLGEVPMPEAALPEGATWRPESGPMWLPPDSTPSVDRIHCYVSGMDDYPRRHGSYRNRVGELLADSYRSASVTSPSSSIHAGEENARTPSRKRR